jgi:hypothetical protein
MMHSMLMETCISMTVQALCMVTRTIGFAPFVVVLFICVVILDLRLFFDADAKEMAQPRHLGVVCLVLWAAWLGYLHLLPDVEAWRAVVYTPSVLVVTRLAVKHTSMRRLFALIVIAEALVMQKTTASEPALVSQGLSFTAFAHVLFFRRISQKEPPSLLWIVVSSMWILLIPWFIAVPLTMIFGSVITQHTLATLKQQDDEETKPDVETPVIDAAN